MARASASAACSSGVRTTGGLSETSLCCCTPMTRAGSGSKGCAASSATAPPACMAAKMPRKLVVHGVVQCVVVNARALGLRHAEQVLDGAEAAVALVLPGRGDVLAGGGAPPGPRV